MSTPLAEDYAQALQNPKNNLIAPDLKTVQPRVDKYGLPIPSVGSFAAVFQVSDEHGAQWALRCFTSTVGDKQERYRLISEALRAARLPYFVEFKYIPEGIRISGKAWPLVRMQWLDGQTFTDYVKEHARERGTLSRLAEQFQTMARSLEACGLAHGDLSGANLLVASGRLFLVDYDCLYSRDLQKLSPPGEGGTPNFRHPLRGRKPVYGPTMDRFTALLCITSLHAMSVDPTLWGTFGASDRLLFTEADLLAPEKSRVFTVLRNHGNRDVRRLSSVLAGWCLRGPDDIPELPPPPRPGSALSALLHGPARKRVAVGVLATGLITAALAIPVEPRSLPDGPTRPTLIEQGPPPPVTQPAPPSPPPVFEAHHAAAREALRQGNTALKQEDLDEARAARERAQRELRLFQHNGGSPEAGRALQETLSQLDQSLRRFRLAGLQQRTTTEIEASRQAEQGGDYLTAAGGLSAFLSELEAEADAELTARDLQRLQKKVNTELSRLKRACQGEIAAFLRRESQCPP